jgi:hypothetical protein
MSKFEPKDLGLAYHVALHGVQSAIAYEIESGKDHGRHSDPKHLRTGIDSAHCSVLGLAILLMEKGIFTMEEYHEAQRLAANNELAMAQENHGATFR